MNAELEAILKAYDAARDVAGAEGKRLRGVYESRLEELLQRHPGVSRATLESMVRLQYARWIKAQSKPTALPPKA